MARALEELAMLMLAYFLTSFLDYVGHIITLPASAGR